MLIKVFKTFVLNTKNVNLCFFKLTLYLSMMCQVAVTEDPRAVMAVALTSEAWYSWLSPQLLHGESFPPGPKVRLFVLILKDKNYLLLMF